VTAADRWRGLHDQHFPELPFDCGNSVAPGVRYSEDLRDWSAKATTPDQRRIETYVDRYDLRQKRLLHIGIGNSSLASRFHERVKEIVGTTIDEPEMNVARSLGLPNYRFLLHNKYSGRNEEVEGKFDFILDNNPTSPCCCFRHLAEMLEFYSDKLAAGGQIVTDSEGLGWVPLGSNPRLSFDFDDLSAVARASGLSAYRANRTVYVLCHSSPPQPDLTSWLRHIGRRVRALPGQIVRHGPRELARISRRVVKSILARVAPRALPGKKR
jgi:hypothetical protein